MTLLLPILAFLTVSLLIAAAAMTMSRGSAATIERRLGELTSAPMAVAGAPSYNSAMLRTLTRVGRAAPKSTSELSKLQQRLVTAGYRRSEALPVFFGIRLACAMVAFGLAANPLIGRPNVVLALGVAALGYLLPSMVLARVGSASRSRMPLTCSW